MVDVVACQFRVAGSCGQDVFAWGWCAGAVAVDGDVACWDEVGFEELVKCRRCVLDRACRDGCGSEKPDDKSGDEILGQHDGVHVSIMLLVRGLNVAEVSHIF